MKEFDKLYEKLNSELARQAPLQTNLRDDRIGNHYLLLTKDGETFTVRVERGDTPNKTKSLKSFTFKDETTARKKYYELRAKIIDKVEKQ